MGWKDPLAGYRAMERVCGQEIAGRELGEAFVGGIRTRARDGRLRESAVAARRWHASLSLRC